MHVHQHVYLPTNTGLSGAGAGARPGTASANEVTARFARPRNRLQRPGFFADTNSSYAYPRAASAAAFTTLSALSRPRLMGVADAAGTCQRAAGADRFETTPLAKLRSYATAGATSTTGAIGARAAGVDATPTADRRTRAGAPPRPPPDVGGVSLVPLAAGEPGGHSRAGAAGEAVGRRSFTGPRRPGGSESARGAVPSAETGDGGPGGARARRKMKTSAFGRRGFGRAADGPLPAADESDEDDGSVSSSIPVRVPARASRSQRAAACGGGCRVARPACSRAGAAAVDRCRAFPASSPGSGASRAWGRDALPRAGLPAAYDRPRASRAAAAPRRPRAPCGSNLAVGPSYDSRFPRKNFCK